MGNLNSCNLYALNWHLYIERVQLCRLLDYFNHYIWWWLSLRLSTRWLKHMERHYLPYCCGADKANRNYRVIWPVVHTMQPIIYTYGFVLTSSCLVTSLEVTLFAHVIYLVIFSGDGSLTWLSGPIPTESVNLPWGYWKEILLSGTYFDSGYCKWYAIITSSNGNIFHVTGPLWGESIDHRSEARSFDVFFDLHMNKRFE